MMLTKNAGPNLGRHGRDDEKSIDDLNDNPRSQHVVG